MQQKILNVVTCISLYHIGITKRSEIKFHRNHTHTHTLNHPVSNEEASA